jgi:hypothetical protein
MADVSAEQTKNLSAEAKEAINDYLYKRARDFFTIVGVTGLGSLIYLIFLVPKIAQNQMTSLIGVKEITDTITTVNVIKNNFPSLQTDTNNLRSEITKLQNTNVEDAAQKVQTIQTAYDLLTAEQKDFVQVIAALQEKNGELETRITALEPGEWQDLNPPANLGKDELSSFTREDWVAFNNEPPQCRKNGDWIEFRGAYDFTKKPFPYVYGLVINDFLPSDCRPKNTWPIAMINCLYANSLDVYGFPGLCGVNFYMGDFTIFSPLPEKLILLMSFEGLRINSIRP